MSTETILNPLTDGEVAQIKQQYRDSEIIQSLFTTHATTLLNDPIVIKNNTNFPIKSGTFVVNIESPVPPFYLPTTQMMQSDTFVSNMCYDRMQLIELKTFVEHEWQNSILTSYSYVMNLPYEDDEDDINTLQLEKLCHMKNTRIIKYLQSKWDFYKKTGTNTPSQSITDLDDKYQDDKYQDAHLYNADLDNSYQYTLRLSLNDFHLVRSYITFGLKKDERNIDYYEQNMLMDYLLSQHECTKIGDCERSHARPAFALPLRIPETLLTKVLKNLNNFRKLNLLIKRYPPIQSSQGLYVYRAQPYFDECTTWNTGHEFTVGRITSTSYSQTGAIQFLRNEHILWKIHLPPGFPLAYVQRSECEVLLPIGTVLRFLGCDVFNGYSMKVRQLNFEAVRIMEIPTNLRQIFDKILIDTPNTTASNLEHFGQTSADHSAYISTHTLNNQAYRQTLADSDPGNFGGQKQRTNRKRDKSRGRMRRRRKTRRRKSQRKNRRNK